LDAHSIGLRRGPEFSQPYLKSAGGNISSAKRAFQNEPAGLGGYVRNGDCSALISAIRYIRSLGAIERGQADFQSQAVRLDG
jgi:hypothetical protein